MMSNAVKNRALTPNRLSDTGGQCLRPQVDCRSLVGCPIGRLWDNGVGEMRLGCCPREDLEKFREPGATPTMETLSWRRPPWLCPWKTVVSIPDRQQVD